MAGKTYAMVLMGVRKMSLQQFDIPEIGEEDGLLRVEMCGLR